MFKTRPGILSASTPLAHISKRKGHICFARLVLEVSSVFFLPLHCLNNLVLGRGQLELRVAPWQGGRGSSAKAACPEQTVAA